MDITSRIDTNYFGGSRPYNTGGGYGGNYGNYTFGSTTADRNAAFVGREDLSNRFTGIENQGATCYLNSLLQTLFHLTYFRAATFKIPSDDDSSAAAAATAQATAAANAAAAVTRDDSFDDYDDYASPPPPPATIPQALQALFYHMQTSRATASTEQLTRSFGWTKDQVMVQHDIQELNRVLCDKLAEKMKGTAAERAVDKLFQGITISYVRCLDIEYTSLRTEKFYDLQVTVSGNNSLYEALDAYVASETLDGENKYCVERDGQKIYSNAQRGIAFKSFPPVLMLHLQRMELDLETMQYTKVNSRFEFPTELTLSKYVDLGADVQREASTQGGEAADQIGRAESIDVLRQQSLTTTPSETYSDGAQERGQSDEERTGTPEDHDYLLFAVMVHKGTPDFGHYYAFIRPDLTKPEDWVRFDDEWVTKATEAEAVEGTYGGDGWNTSWGWQQNTANAYMLVYVRRSVCDRLVWNATSEQIVPAELREHLETVALEAAKKRAEAEEMKQQIEVTCITAKHLPRTEDISGREVIELITGANTNAPGASPTAATGTAEDEPDKADDDKEKGDKGDDALTGLPEGTGVVFRIPTTFTMGRLKQEIARRCGVTSTVRLWLCGKQRVLRPLLANDATEVHERHVFDTFVKDKYRMEQKVVFIEEPPSDETDAYLPQSGYDIASLGTATQSSTLVAEQQSCDASNAITVEGSGDCYSSTARTDHEPWWEVELPAFVPILKIDVKGHASRSTISYSASPYWNRYQEEEVLKGVRIEVYDQERELVWNSDYHTRRDRLVIDFRLLGISIGGKIVRVLRRPQAASVTDPQLQLERVRVFALYRPTQPTLPPIASTTDGALLWIKRYHPAEARTTLEGYLVSDDDVLVHFLLPRIRQIAGIAPNTPIILYSERANGQRLDLVDRFLSLHDNGADCGGTLIVQEQHVPGGPFEYPTAARLLTHLREQRGIVFIDLDTNVSLELTLSERLNYEEAQQQLARRLGGDVVAQNIQFTGYDSFDKCPRSEPFRLRDARGQVQALREMLKYRTVKYNRLYYRVLPITVADWEGKTRVALQVASTTVKTVQTLQMTVPDDVSHPLRPADIIAFAKRQLGDRLPAGALQLFRVVTSCVAQIYTNDDVVDEDDVCDSTLLRLDPAPRPLEGIALDEQRLVPVCHFEVLPGYYNRYSNEYHSDPFLMYVSANDTAASVLARIQERLGLSEKVMSSWTLCVHGTSSEDILAADDVVFTYLDSPLQRAVSSSSDDGLVHIALRHPLPKARKEEELRIAN
eukprot:TRINITY_DN11457_c0_g1_i2.p1 TRINITY_DN11457_c0_g1~~TRINITY_DN11457_c0_g1_i2.p1  ORF type:complete len:1274 (+),score=280.98 TRINITY_DN11457_c0_g1_i2:971-4792(+)